MAEENKNWLLDAIQPFVEGAKHSYSAIAGDIEGKGVLGTTWSALNQMAAGAPHVFMPRVPVYRSAVQELSPDAIVLMKRMGLDPNAVKQVGSKSMGEIFSGQVGGPISDAIAELIRAGKFGQLPK